MGNTGFYKINTQEKDVTEEIDDLRNEMKKLDDYCDELWELKEKKRINLKINIQRDQTVLTKEVSIDSGHNEQIDVKNEENKVNTFCPYCGAFVNGMKFCGKCGKQVN
ncbi:MAG: hypothetical protein KH160_05445 [Ruminococcus sp.]|nr:hypothetical protein [Ruminococcus sp.]